MEVIKSIRKSKTEYLFVIRKKHHEQITPGAYELNQYMFTCSMSHPKSLLYDLFETHHVVNMKSSSSSPFPLSLSPDTPDFKTLTQIYRFCVFDIGDPDATGFYSLDHPEQLKQLDYDQSIQSLDL